MGNALPGLGALQHNARSGSLTLPLPTSSISNMVRTDATTPKVTVSPTVDGKLRAKRGRQPSDAEFKLSIRHPCGDVMARGDKAANSGEALYTVIDKLTAVEVANSTIL